MARISICRFALETIPRDDRNGHLTGIMRSYYVGARKKKIRGSAELEVVPLFTVECGLTAKV